MIKRVHKFYEVMLCKKSAANIVSVFRNVSNHAVATRVCCQVYIELYRMSTSINEIIHSKLSVNFIRAC